MAIDLEKYKKATTTPQTGIALGKYKKQTVEEPKKDGFFKSLVKDAAGTLLVKPAARVAELVGRTGMLGENIQRGYQEMSKAGEGQRIFGIDVEAQKGFGQGGAKQIAGDALKSASYLYGGGKAVQVGGATIKGQMLRGFVQGAKGGAVSGASYGAGTELQREGSTTKSVLAQGAIGGVVGGVSGGVLGGLLPAPIAAVKGTQNALNPSKIMQRVARVNALDEQKFQQTAKESIGDYLVKRGIYGNDEEIMTQLAQRFTQAKQTADDAIMRLPGTYKPEPVRTALSEMIERESRISSPGAPSRDFGKVSQLVQKYDSQGLTMSEINEVKRIFERNNKLDYLKQNLPEAVARANTLDDAIRSWQFKQADDLGLKNLGEINRETRLAKQLGDALFKKNVRSSGNNAFGLTDAILLSGGDPQAIGMLVAKKTFGSKNIQSKVAKTLAGEPSVGIPQAIFGEAVPQEQMIPPVVIPKAQPQNTLDLRVIQGASTQSLPQSGTVQSKATLPKTILPVRDFSNKLSTGEKYAKNREEALAMLEVELGELSNAGYRYQKGDMGEFTGVGSTFPKWIPEEYRSKELFNSVMEYVNKDTPPPPHATRQKELYDIIQSELESRIENKPKSIPLSRTGNSEVFAGAAVGFEKDENGEWVFNKEKAMAGMVGVAGLTRSQAVQKLSKDLDSGTRKIMTDFIDAVRLNMTKKAGRFEFKNAETMTEEEARKAFDKGLGFIYGEAGEKLNNKNISKMTPEKIAEFFEDIVSKNRDN